MRGCQHADRHECNAICLGGPCHGLLAHIDQDIGVLDVPVPHRAPDEPETCARYRITRERVRYCDRPTSYIALHWACDCSAP